jgi:hypothetical protein
MMVPGHSKELGFWTSLNCPVTFLALLPLFMLFFAFQIEPCAVIRSRFSTEMIITDANGAAVPSDTVNADWHAHLRKTSPILWALLTAVILQCWPF